MKRIFRDFIITRTCTKQYLDPTSYKPFLKTDFSSRCAYCNLLDSIVTTPFEVDHYIPRDVYKVEWPECESLYDNLIYSCKKCNREKSSHFIGDISGRKIVNDYFYNPVEIDYGLLFFRNDLGGIDSEDEKGREMIEKLKLYRPIHNMAWICETLQITLEKLKNKIDEVGRNSEQGKLLLLAKEELYDYYFTCQQVFVGNYNNSKFEIQD